MARECLCSILVLAGWVSEVEFVRPAHCPGLGGARFGLLQMPQMQFFRQKLDHRWVGGGSWAPKAHETCTPARISQVSFLTGIRRR